MAGEANIVSYKLSQQEIQDVLADHNIDETDVDAIEALINDHKNDDIIKQADKYTQEVAEQRSSRLKWRTVDLTEPHRHVPSTPATLRTTRRRDVFVEKETETHSDSPVTTPTRRRAPAPKSKSTAAPKSKAESSSESSSLEESEVEGTTSFYSAWDRHINALRLKYATFISTFLTICERLHPHVIAAAEIDELPDATTACRGPARTGTDCAHWSIYVAEHCERGFRTKFVVQEVETTGTSRLDTKLQQQLQWYTNGSHSATAIHAYATTVQQYANSNSGTVDEAQYQVQGGLPASP
nr:hypothetical protein LTR18_008888 [Exophiala xenobiotica]